MDIDKLFSEEIPVWLQRVFEKNDRETMLQLKEHSAFYADVKNQIRQIYEKYPRLVVFIDNNVKTEFHDFLLDEAKALAELICLEFKIMEMYECVFYLKGIRDGYELKDLAEKIKRTW